VNVCARTGWGATAVSITAIASAALAPLKLGLKIKFRSCLGFAIDVFPLMLGKSGGVGRFDYAAGEVPKTRNRDACVAPVTR
jgi:hypothetical protein